MTSITHEALCRNEFCPEPRNPDFHECVACGRPAVEHAHIVARSRAPSRRKDKNNVVALCHEHHELQTLNKWAFHEQALPFEGLVHQWLTDERGATVWKRDVRGSSDGGKAAPSGTGEKPGSHLPPSPGASSATDEDSGGSARELVTSSVAPGVSSDGGEEGDSQSYVVATTSPPSPDAGADKPHAASSSVPSGGDGVLAPPAPSPSFSPLKFLDNGIEFEPEFTFDEWKEAAERVKTDNKGRQWRAGDLYNAGDDRWAEAHQYLDELGYPQETLANLANVCRAYPISERRSLPFTFHQALYKLPERLQWLDRCILAGWNRQELREAALGPGKPKAKRWTAEQLREDLAAWPGEPSVRNNGPRYLAAALDWLEAR